jgi:hypothetical protein
MQKTISTVVSLLIGSIMTVNGINAIKPEEATATAAAVVNEANVYQLTTALELYYSDHDAYPAARDANTMVTILEDSGYLRKAPADASIYEYRVSANQSDYTLKLKQG